MWPQPCATCSAIKAPPDYEPSLVVLDALDSSTDFENDMEQFSKSELKRQHKQIEAAAREIVRLNDNELKRLSLG